MCAARLGQARFPRSCTTTEDDHVKLAQDVHPALLAENKNTQLEIYPAFEGDGHELFFEVRDLYWDDVIAYLSGL